MINFEYKNIFIHIPKTAGTSMEKMYFIGYDPNIVHHSMKMLSHRILNVGNFFKWCFVRNPLDRLVSAYHWGIKNHKDEYLSDIKSFDDFIEKIEDFYDFDKLSHWKQLRSGIHVIPQYLYIEGYEMDFIGKFENLSSDWTVLCNKLSQFNNCSIEGELPKTYKSNHKKYTNYYNDKQKEKIYNLYKKDFENFKYEI